MSAMKQINWLSKKRACICRNQSIEESPRLLESMRKARDAIADESVAMKSNLGCVDLKALVSLAAIGEVSAARVSWGDKGW